MHSVKAFFIPLTLKNVPEKRFFIDSSKYLGVFGLRYCVEMV